MSESVESVSVEQAHDLKQQRSSVAAAKIWRTSNWPNAAAFAAFLNLNPAQGAGEAFARSRANGSVDGFYFL